MDLKELQVLVADWFPGFERRFTARFSASESLPSLFWIVSFLYLLDTSHLLRFGVDDHGQPLFAISEVAKALGVNEDHFIGLAWRWQESLHETYLHERPATPGGEVEGWITFSGLVVTVNSLQCEEVISREYAGRLARVHGILRAGVLNTMQVTSDDTERLSSLFVPNGGVATA